MAVIQSESPEILSMKYEEKTNVEMGIDPARSVGILVDPRVRPLLDLALLRSMGLIQAWRTAIKWNRRWRLRAKFPVFLRVMIFPSLFKRSIYEEVGDVFFFLPGLRCCDSVVVVVSLRWLS